MTIQNPTRQQAYEARVRKFAGNKTFQYLTNIKVKRGDIRCDACGSKLVQELRLIRDDDNNHYLIGANCYTLLYNEHKINGLCPYDPKHLELAKRLIEQRKFAKYFIELVGDFPVFTVERL